MHMSAYDFRTFGSNPRMTASQEERTQAFAERLRRFAQDIIDGKSIVYTIEVKSLFAPDEVIKTVLTVTFTEVKER